MEDIMDTDVAYVTSGLDQEEVAREMVRHELSAIPVLDEQHRLLGVITHDDIIDVLSEEATEDIYRLANVADIGLEPESPVRDHLRGRLPWLYLNSLTALFAAWVISHFEEIIAQVAVLAVFQSVVAAQGGNAAMQSVAMMVRSMALGKVIPKRNRQIIMREMLVSLIQGLAIGLVLGVGVALWRGNIYLGLVLALALLGNMLVAGVVGSATPLFLRSLGLDPALASSIFVTAATDSMGFFIFLSLANHFIGHLL
jgi:magnesium transporter